MNRHKTKWTEGDDRLLSFEWGHKAHDLIARDLGRTITAVRARVERLGLNGQRGYLSLSEVSRKTGYNHRAIQRLADRFGIPLRRYPCARKDRLKRGRYYAITEDQYELITAAIHRLGVPFRVESTGEGEWGTGRKPSACRRCQRANKPHYSKGLCRSCHDRVRRDGTLTSYPSVRRGMGGQR